MESQKLPNATAVLIMGILSLLGCCFYFSGLVFGIIGLVLAKKDLQMYRAQPDAYSNYQSLNVGRILSIIGVVINALFILAFLAFIVKFGTEVIGNPDLLRHKLEALQRQ